MPDVRFFRRAGPFSLGEIAALVGAEPVGAADAGTPIHDIAALDCAEADDISVFTDTRYLDALLPTRAGAIIISRKLAHHAHGPSRLIFVANPRLAYAQVGLLFYPLPELEAGIDANARVHSTASVGAGSKIDAGAVIGRGVEIGKRCHVAFNAVLGNGVRLGDDCRIGANTNISHAIIGRRVEIETGVTIGSQGFGFVPNGKGLTRMLQLGRVIIEDDVQIGANCAVDRGATGDTLIGAGSVLDNLVQIAHNVRLGRHCVGLCAGRHCRKYGRGRRGDDWRPKWHLRSPLHRSWRKHRGQEWGDTRCRTLRRSRWLSRGCHQGLASSDRRHLAPIQKDDVARKPREPSTPTVAQGNSEHRNQCSTRDRFRRTVPTP